MPQTRRPPLAALAVLVTASGCIANAPPERVGTSESASTVCGDTTVKGMDVSHYDGTIDWATAHSSGIDFAFVKATEGTTFVDPMFAANWSGMKAAGVVRGAYHFFHSNMDPVTQANFVVSTVGTLETGDLPIVIDLEVTDGNSEATVISTAGTFLAAVTKATGVTAMIYVSPAFLSDYSSFAGNPLWVANWGVKCPDVPAAWTTWTFWQNSDTGTVSGVSGASSVDLDYFNGSLADLAALGVGGGTDAGSVGDAAGTAEAGNGESAAPPPDDAGDRDSGATGHHGGEPGNPDGGARGAGGAAGTGWDHQAGSGGCAVSSPASGAGGWAAVLVLVPALLSMRRRRSSSDATRSAD
jgi:lysozyme